MSMDITQLQAVLTARDEASPVVQSFLNLIRQARDATSGYGAATASSLNSVTPAWQAQFDASQRAISKLSEMPGAAAAAASAMSGLGQAASVSGQQAATAVDAVARSLGNVGPAAQQAAQQVQTAMNQATTAAQNAAQQMQRFGQGTLPTGSGFSATGQSRGDIETQRALADAQRQAIINSTQAVQTAIPNINQASEAWNRYSNAVSGAKGPTTESVNVTTQMRQALIAAGTSIEEVNARTKALTSTHTESATATKAHSEAWVSLGGIMSHLPGPLGEVGSAFGTIHEKITQAQASLLAISAVATMVGVSILGSLGGAVEAAGHFESTFAQVKTVLEGTGETIDQFQEKALQLGVQTQFNSQKVAEGFYELSSAGLNVRESLAAIEPAIQAATLGHQQLNTTTFALATTMRQFGLEASDMTRIVDVMARMAADSTLHWSEMSAVFRNVQGSAKFMNISIEETGAALEVMANAATPATMAGTAFRTFLDRLSKGTGEAGSAMRALNLQMYDEKGAFVGLLPIMQQIEAATKGMTDAEKDGIVAKLGGARANALIRDTLNAKKDVEIEGQTVTLHGTEVLGYFIQRNQEAAGAAQRMFEITKQTFEFQRDVFSASIQEAAIRVGNQLLPALTAILPVFTSVVNAFIQAPPAVHAAATAMAVVSGTMLTIVGTAGTLAIILPLLTAAFTGTATASAASAAAIGASAAAGATAAATATASATAMEAAGLATTASTAAMVTALGPLALIVGGLVVASGVLAVAWANDWGNIRERTAEQATATKTYLSDLRDDLDLTAKFLGTMGGRAGAGVGGMFSGLGTEVHKAITEAFGGEGAANAAGAAGTAIGQVYVGAFLRAVVSASPAGGALLLFKDVASAVGTGFDAVKNAIEAASPEMKQAMGDAFYPDETTRARQWADMQAGALDAVAFGAVDKIKHGSDVQDAALQELWARVSVTTKDGVRQFGTVTREELDTVIGRIREILKMPGIEEQVANVLGNVEDAYSASMRRLMANADGDIGKALKEAIAEGSQRQAIELLNVESGQKLVKDALRGTNTEYQAQVRIMEQATGAESAYEAVQRTLQFLLANGNITTKEYGQWLAGVAVEHEKAGKAATSAAAAERDLMKAMTPGQRVFEQSANAAVGNITKGLTLDKQAMLADLTDGLPKQEALRRIVEASGTKINLADLYYGSPQEVADREALIAAALQGGAISKLPPIVKEQGKAAGQAVATGVTEAVPEAQAAGEAVGTAVTTGITTSLTGRAFDPEEMRARLDAFAAGVLPFAADAGAEIGNEVDAGVKDALTASDAAATADAYIQGLDDNLDATPALEASAAALGTSVDAKVAEVISPERASEITTSFITSIGDTFANTPVPPDKIESVLQGLKNQFKTGLDEGTLTEEDAANWVKVATIALARAATNSTDVKAVGAAVDTGIATGASDAAESELAPVLATAIDTAAGAVSDAAQTSGREKVGRPLVLGIAQGIRLSPGPVQSAVQEIIDAAIDAAKDKAGIHSPSDVMATEVGLPLAQGIGVGFLGGIGSVKAQVQAGVADLVSGAGGELSRGMGSLVSHMHAELAQAIQSEDPTGEEFTNPNLDMIPPGWQPGRMGPNYGSDPLNRNSSGSEAAGLWSSREAINQSLDWFAPLQSFGTRGRGSQTGTLDPYAMYQQIFQQMTEPSLPNHMQTRPDPWSDDPWQDSPTYFSPGGRGGMARGVGGFDLNSLLGTSSSQAAIREVAEVLASDIGVQVTAATGAAISAQQTQPTGPYTPPFTPSQQVQTGLERHEDKHGNVTYTPTYRSTTAQEQAQQAQDVANQRLPDWANPLLNAGAGGGSRGGPPSPAAPPYQPVGTMLPDGRIMGPNGTWLSQDEWVQSYAARTGAQATPANMAVRPSPVNLGGVGGYGLTPNGTMTDEALQGFLASLSGSSARQPIQVNQELVDAYAEQRRALQDASRETRQYIQDQRDASESTDDYAQRLGSYADQLTGSNRGRGSDVYPAYPDFPRGYVPNNPNASDAEIQQYQHAMYNQALQRDSGIVAVDARFSGNVPYSQGQGPWWGVPQNNPYVTQGQFNQLNAGYQARNGAYQSAYYGAMATGANINRDSWTPYFPGGEPNRYAPLNEANAANAPYSQLDSMLRMASGNLDLFNTALSRTQGSVDTTTRTFGQLSEADQQRVIAQRAYFDENGQLVSGLRDASGNIKEFAGVVRNADGSLDRVATSANLAAVQQGRFITGMGDGLTTFTGLIQSVDSVIPRLVGDASQLSDSFIATALANQQLASGIAGLDTGFQALTASQAGADLVFQQIADLNRGITQGTGGVSAGQNFGPGQVAGGGYLQQGGGGTGVSALLPGNVNPGAFYTPDVNAFAQVLAQANLVAQTPLFNAIMTLSRSGGTPFAPVDVGGFAAPGTGQAANVVGGQATGPSAIFYGGSTAVNAQGKSYNPYFGESAADQEANRAAQQKFAAEMQHDAQTASNVAKALINNISLSASAWGDAASSSANIRTSVAGVQGAFSAYAMDLNAKMASSLTGSWTVPSIGGPSGPNTSGPGSGPSPANGNTYGAQSMFALQQLIDQLSARGINGGDTNFQSELTKLRQTDKEYIRVVGETTMTLGDYQREQEEAQTEVSNLSNVMRQLGDAYGSGIGIAAQLAAAQARLAAATAGAAAAAVNPVGPQVPGYTQYVQPPGFQGPSYYAPTGTTIANTIATRPGPNGTTLAGVNQTGGSQTGSVMIQGVLVPLGLSSMDTIAYLEAHGVHVSLPENPLQTGGVTTFGSGGIAAYPQLAIVGDSGPELIIPLEQATQRMQFGASSAAYGGSFPVSEQLLPGGSPGSVIGGTPSGPPPAPYQAIGGITVGVDGVTTWNGVPIPGYEITPDGVWLQKDGVRLTVQEARILAGLRGITISQAQMYALTGTNPPTPGSTTGSTLGTPTVTSTGQPVKNYGPVHIINSNGVSDFYQQPDGSFLQAMHGSRITIDSSGYGYANHKLPVNLSGSKTAIGAVEGPPPAFILNPSDAKPGSRMIRTDDKLDTYIQPDGSIIQVPHGSVMLTDIGGHITWGPPPPPPVVTTTPTGPMLPTSVGGTTISGNTGIISGGHGTVPTSVNPGSFLPTAVLPTPIFTGGRGFANEGIAWQRQVAEVAEHGPEVIERLDRRIARVASQGGGGGDNITVGDVHIHMTSTGNSAIDGALMARQFRVQLRRQGTDAKRSQGI